MQIAWLPFLVAVILVPTQGKESNTKLLLVQILFRHAQRAPVILYPTDPNPVDVWPEGLGKLSLLGKKQAYALGKLFRKMYGDFITSNPNEVTVNSSNVDRSIRSALANVAAFYKPSPQWTFEDDVNWQPIPVYSVPVEEDMYLSGQMPCPRSNEVLGNILVEQRETLLKDHKEMIDNLTFHTGRRMDNIISFILLQDTLEIESDHNLIIPSWAEYYWEELMEVAEPMMSSISQSPVVQRLRIGPLLGKIVDDMKRKSEGEIPNIKVRLYSSHDFLVANMLEALKVSNKIRPPYCASVIFELHEKTDGEKAVRLLYLNSSTPEDVYQAPHLLILDGCSEYCPLDYFEKFTKDAVPVDWKEECKCEYECPNSTFWTVDD